MESTEKGGRMGHLSSIAKELQKCARCGECRSVCPVFNELGWEKYAARGKVALTRAAIRGEIELNGSYAEVVYNCLLCLACVENCGGGVRLDRIVVAARSELARTKGLSLFRRLAHGLLSSGRELLDTIARGGSVAQYLLFKRLPDSSGLKRRFPLPMVDRDRQLPSLALRPFRSRRPERNPVPGARQKVIFFTGCLINYVYPDIGEAVVRVLNRLRREVIVPRGQHCCGTPAMVGGDVESARRLARKNLDLLFPASYDIVTACASGGYMLKRGYADLFEHGDPYRRRALSVARRTFDISEYLLVKIGMSIIQDHLQPEGLQKVTYHDPCHLIRGQGIGTEPRWLLQAAFGNRFVEMREADRCCGSGGTYGLTHRDTSLRILQRKTRQIVATGADLVATGCPGCMIQLQDGLGMAGSGIRVNHVIQLIESCLINSSAGTAAKR